MNKIGEAGPGEIVALGRMDGVRTGDLLSASDKEPDKPEPLDVPVLKPVYTFGIHAEQRDDEVKLSDALSKLLEEDRSLTAEQNPRRAAIPVARAGRNAHPRRT